MIFVDLQMPFEQSSTAIAVVLMLRSVMADVVVASHKLRLVNHVM